MQYLLLIYNNEKAWSDMPEEQQGKVFQEYMEFASSIRKSGHLVGGEALQPVSSATTVRKPGGKIVHTDGPFAETKEQLGGYFVVEAKDLDEALAIAARVPELNVGGSIEVRPIMPTPKVE